MESLNQTSNETISDENQKENINYWKWIAIGFIAIVVIAQGFEIRFSPRFSISLKQRASVIQEQDSLNLEEFVLPSEGVILPVRWGSLGKQMIETGVIDKEEFESIYSKRGGLSEDNKKLLYGADNGNLVIDKENSGYLLNLLWAFGLANKSPVLEEGPMQDKKYGGDASRFASTGGWSLSEGNVMDHYSGHTFITLTPEQQDLVMRVSQNIYRPCCGNSTYFPDCNHGMAMIGLLELLAGQGIGEEEMYKVALQVNSYWFPSAYLTIAKYFEKRGVSWSEVNPKDILASTYSGASGYQRILQEVEPPKSSSGGGCGV